MAPVQNLQEDPAPFIILESSYEPSKPLGPPDTDMTAASTPSIVGPLLGLLVPQQFKGFYFFSLHKISEPKSSRTVNGDHHEIKESLPKSYLEQW